MPRLWFVSKKRLCGQHDTPNAVILVSMISKDLELGSASVDCCGEKSFVEIVHDTTIYDAIFLRLLIWCSSFLVGISAAAARPSSSK